MYHRAPTNSPTGATFAEIILGHQLDTFTHVLGNFSTVSATSTIIYPPQRWSTPNRFHLRPSCHCRRSHCTNGHPRVGALVSMIYRAGYESTSGRTAFLWEIDCEKGSIRVEAPATTGPLSHLMNIHDMPVYVCGEKVGFDGTGLLGNLATSWLGYLKEKRGEGKAVPSVRPSYVVTALCTSSTASASTARNITDMRQGVPSRRIRKRWHIQIVQDPGVDLVVISIKALRTRDLFGRIEAGKINGVIDSGRLGKVPQVPWMLLRMVGGRSVGIGRKCEQ
ncbi:transcription regulator gal [Salix suchowensis]|nr:transcription regulator gal [Salix suchowensis]